MAKIAFINPSQDFEDIYGSLADERSVLPPLGLCYLAGSLRAEGHDVRIIDAAALNISNEEASRLSLEWGAGYVGITATTDNVFLASDIADAIKSASKDIKVIIGGAHLTAIPEKTLEMFPSFDIGVIGEGEDTLKELINALEAKKDLNEVNGIVFRSAGNVKTNAPRSFIKDLDSLPYPAWGLLPSLSKYYKPVITNYKRMPSASLVTSRGCPGKCAFCDTRVFGSRYRAHSAGYVLGMIGYLKDNYGIRDICFYDDVFTVFKKRLEEICKALKDKKYDISWSCQARVNSVNYETLKMMKEAGCWKVSFGIESASNDILKLMNKDIAVEQSRKAVMEAKRAGLEVEGYFILGFFGETKDTMKMTKDFILRSPLDIVILSHFLPYPGSPAYPHVKEYGSFTEDWKMMNAFDRPRFIPNGLTTEDIINIQDEIYKGFYFRPRLFAKYALRIAKNPAYAPRIIKSSLNLAKFILRK